MKVILPPYVMFKILFCYYNYSFVSILSTSELKFKCLQLGLKFHYNPCYLYLLRINTFSKELQHIHVNKMSLKYK